MNLTRDDATLTGELSRAADDGSASKHPGSVGSNCTIVTSLAIVAQPSVPKLLIE